MNFLKKILWLIVFSFAFTAKAQLPVGEDTITVIENGKVLKLAWAGGLNFCVFSQMDVNQDGKQDIIVFDKVNSFNFGIIKCFVNVGGTGEVKYVFSSHYSKKFPPVNQWALCYDYNNDGKADLLTYAIGGGGIRVYKNTSTTGNLSFALAKPLIETKVGILPAYIYASAVSLPGFADIDGDGDMDVLTFSSTGFQIEYHKNKSKELYGHADSLVYELDEFTWGDIVEVNCNVTLNQFFMKPTGGINTQNTLHSGSCLMCFDRDGDNDQDLIIGDIGCSTISYCENIGDNTNAHIGDTTKIYPNYPLKANTQPIKMNTFPCTYYLDVDNDNKKDLLASPYSSGGENFKSVWFYKNKTTNNEADFEFTKNNFLQDEMMEHGEGAYPVLFDADNDGLLDLIVGNHGYYEINNQKTKLAYYKNIGTLTQPSFSLITRDYAGLSSYATTHLTQNFVPTFGDIDGDGDKDMIIGDAAGKIHWVENTAGSGNPCNFSIFKFNPFGIITGFNASFPQLIDVNRDGLLDLIIGMFNGRLAYYQNNGTSTAPSFTLITNNFGNVNVKGDPSTYGSDGRCAPFMFDDNGTYKLLSGSISGRIFYYDNIDGNLNGNFNLIDTNVNKINIGMATALQYVDIDGDNKRDLIVGNYAGGLNFYSSKSTIGIKELYDAKSSSVLIYPNPTKDFVTIKSNNPLTEKIEIEVFDIYGKIILKETTPHPYKRQNTSEFNKGVYFIKTTTFEGLNSQTTVTKLILQ